MSDTSPGQPIPGQTTIPVPGEPTPAAAKKVAAKKAAAAVKETIPRGPGKPSNDAKLTEKLVDMFVLVGVSVSAFDTFDGATIIGGAPDLAASLVTLANESPAVKKALETSMTSSAWLGVAMAISPIVVSILANHKVLPEGLKAMSPAVGTGADPLAGLAALFGE